MALPKDLRSLIAKVIKTLTKKELFMSGQYHRYLTKQACVLTGQYDPPTPVQLDWNIQPGADIAYTDTTRIYINLGNELSLSCSEDADASFVHLGLLAHETGHINWTDLEALKAFRDTLGSPVISCPLDARQKSALENLINCFDEEDALATAVIKERWQDYWNVLEDVYVNAMTCQEFPGKIAKGICMLLAKQSAAATPPADEWNAGLQTSIVMRNAVLHYAIMGKLDSQGMPPEFCERFEQVQQLVDTYTMGSAQDRLCAALLIVLTLWEYLEQEVIFNRFERRAKNRTTTQQMQQMEGQKRTGAAPTAKQPAGKPVPGKQSKPGGASQGNATLQNLRRKQAGNSNGEGVKEAQDGDLDDMRREIAKGKAEKLAEKELSEELRNKINRLDLPPIHGQVSLTLERALEIEAHWIREYHALMDEVQPVLRQLLGSLTAFLMSQEQDEMLRGLYSGNAIDVRSLFDPQKGNFKKRKEFDSELDIAVMLMIDCSGSMNGLRIHSARAAALALYLYCGAIGIPISVYGHNVLHEGEVSITCAAEYRSVDGEDKYRIAGMTTGGVNHDGAAVRFAEKMLTERPEKSKLFMLISDGLPNGCNKYKGQRAIEDLQAFRKRLLGQGVMFIAAAIGDDRQRIQEIYGNSFMDVSELSRLPANMVGILNTLVA